MMSFDPRIIHEMMKGKYRLTIQEMAEELEVSRYTVSKWLHGKSAMPAWALGPIAEILGCEVGDFFDER